MISDVVVIGGGPAGAAAARLLASWGYSVLLLTRTVAQAPAESIPPSTRKLFDQLGIADAIDNAGFIRTTGNTIWWGGQERVVSFPEGEYGYQVDRAQFDGLMLALTAEAGARIESSATVLDVTTGDADNLVRYVTERGEQLTRAGWVLDCSGRSGVIARHGYRRAQPGPRTLALLATWDRPEGWSLQDESHTLVESYETGWAWSVMPLRSSTRFPRSESRRLSRRPGWPRSWSIRPRPNPNSGSRRPSSTRLANEACSIVCSGNPRSSRAMPRKGMPTPSGRDDPKRIVLIPVPLSISNP